MEELIKSLGPGAMVCLGLFSVFAVADGFVSEGFRRWLSRHLVRVRPPKMSNRWPITFLIIFRRVFGRKALSWRFFGRSCLASLLGVAIMFIVWELVHPGALGNFVQTLAVWLEEPDGWITVALVIMVPAAMNFLPDYFSLIESRLILRAMSGRSGIVVVMLLALDFVFTSAIFLVIGPILLAVVVTSTTIILYLPSLSLNSFGQIFDPTLQIIGFILEDGIYLLPAEGNLSTGIFVYSTFFTSVWVWLYISSMALIRLASHSQLLIRFLQFALPIQEKPLRAIGTVAFIPGILVSGLVSVVSDMAT